MNLRLRAIERLDEALSFSPLLDRCAAAALAEFRDDPLPADVTRRFLERRFDAPETLVLVAELPEDGRSVGFAVVGPLEDPLTAEVLPMLVILHVDPEHRHQGIARGLVAEAERLLGARGIGPLCARAAHNDDALISMGERWGFVRNWELMVRE